MNATPKRTQSCSVEGCHRWAKAKGLCNTHHERLRRTGRLDLRSDAERFWLKVDKSGVCWLWTAAKNNQGYGQFLVARRLLLAHRFAYELVKGPIPTGLTLDHLCRTPACVNPDHLEAVTMRTNLLRGNGQGALNARKTHCKWGHLLEGENLQLRKGKYGVVRFCRACNIRRCRERRET